MAALSSSQIRTLIREFVQLLIREFVQLRVLVLCSTSNKRVCSELSECHKLFRPVGRDRVLRTVGLWFMLLPFGGA